MGITHEFVKEEGVWDLLFFIFFKCGDMMLLRFQAVVKATERRVENVKPNASKSSGRPRMLIFQIITIGAYDREDSRMRGIREMTVELRVMFESMI